jgi:hypothetical protein
VLGAWRISLCNGVGCSKRLRNLKQGVALLRGHSLKAFEQVDGVTLCQQTFPGLSKRATMPDGEP